MEYKSRDESEVKEKPVKLVAYPESLLMYPYLATHALCEDFLAVAAITQSPIGYQDIYILISLPHMQ